MLRRKTLFIVGAGASSEAKLPLGSELLSKIGTLIGTDGPGPVKSFSIQQGIQLIANHNGNRQDVYSAAPLINRNVSQVFSIDTFLEAHKNNQFVTQVGKMLIAYSILSAERNSILMTNPSNHPGASIARAVADTWYVQLLHILVDGVFKDQIQELPNSISFITFNYDRCIEHYLCNALQNYYNLTDQEAYALANKFRVLHPYGRIAPLQWQDDPGGVSFGADPDHVGIWGFTNRIRTFTERIVDEQALGSIHEQMSWADQIVFLGFAYYKQNMDLLTAGISRTGTPFKPQLLCGTVFGESEQNMEVIERILNNTFQGSSAAFGRRYLAPIKCQQFLRDYRRVLTEY